MFNEVKFVFFGTDELAVKFLNGLTPAGFHPALIVTTPDKPKGRRMILTPAPVKVWAEQNNISLIQPNSLREIPPELKQAWDVFVIASYGKIIPQVILDRPAHGALNIHPSLLPKYRGAAPLESAILNGDTETGVTIIKLDAEMDHGPIVAQTKISLADWQPDYEELRDKLAEAGAKLFLAKIEDYLADKIIPTEQDHGQASYTKKIEKADGEIKLTDGPELNYRKIRAFTPWPGTYFFADKKGQPLRILIKKAHLEHGELKIDRVLPEGKKDISWDEFKNNYLK